MRKEFLCSETNVLMNFSKKYCTKSIEIIESNLFNKILASYIKNLEKNNQLLIEKFNTINDSEEELITSFIDLFKLLLILNFDQVVELNAKTEKINGLHDELVEFVDGLYNYWRKLERYALVYSREEAEGIEGLNFIEETNKFTDLILFTYRRILTNILGGKFNVYRQLQAGLNVGLMVTGNKWDKPVGYEGLSGINFISSVILRAPFITYPKKNKRAGIFSEIDFNPISKINLNEDDWLCYPALVGEFLTYTYFNRKYINHGVSLCNLFELVKKEDFSGRKPDLIYVFGADLDQEIPPSYYIDKKNDIYVGFANASDEIDYFGYMKKMLLTLHNIKMLDNGHLPIHGAMVAVTMIDGTKANIAIVGDSGAGKSESLEAFRVLSASKLKDLKIIFDDMGTFKIEDGKVIGYGTETGAFVRVDDLDDGYAYQELDRGIFMNPHRQNARLLIPVAPYDVIMKGYEVDILLYANNYEKLDSCLTFFNNVDDAKKIFVSGRRKAKGTTTEEGLVDSYFANPFGPVQRKEQCDILIDKVYDQLFENKIPVGQIYTQLGIPGREMAGPKDAALKLLEWIKSVK